MSRWEGYPRGCLESRYFNFALFHKINLTDCHFLQENSLLFCTVLQQISSTKSTQFRSDCLSLSIVVAHSACSPDSYPKVTPEIHVEECGSAEKIDYILRQQHNHLYLLCIRNFKTESLAHNRVPARPEFFR